MRQTLMRLWRKPWGKALLAALYSAASIILYFIVAQIAYGLWGATIVPDIGRDRTQAQAQSTDPAEVQRLTQVRPYTSPGSPGYQAPAPSQAPNAPSQ